MARSDSFQKKWAAVPSQFERPSDALIDRGWAGGAAEDPPEAKWENWWHNRVDEALAEIEKNGAMQWFADVPYAIGASARSGGQNYIAALTSTGIQPGSAADVGHWIKLRVDTSGVVTTIDTSATLSSQQLGLVLLDASGGALTLTLPAANAELDVREVVLRRVDVTSNALVIAASGADKIMLDTTAESAGQATTELLFAGDFLRLRSDGAGKWWCVGQAQLPGSIASGLVAFTAPGSDTFTVPPVLRSGRHHPRVTVTGGGGGGGGGVTSPTAARGGGGGGGGTAIGIISLAGASSVPVTVGGGGTGGGSGANGANGGSSSFGTYLSAVGGDGGGGATSSNAPSGGQGGTASGGAANLTGGAGSDGPVVNGAGTAGSGDGGASVWGGGSRSASGAPLDPAALGSGGGGTDEVGGAGAPGLVVIEW